MQASAAAPPLGKSVVLLALRRRFAALRPDIEISPAGCVGRIEDNLLPGVEPRHFVEDLQRGDGNEIESKFRAVHSSAALAVNTFARFKDEPAHLMLAGDSGFEALTFERACPTGLCGGRPPNLDLLAQGPGGVVGVGSKLTEPRQRTTPSFSPAYGLQIRDERRAGAWFRAMETVLGSPDSFGSLDAAQLISTRSASRDASKGSRSRCSTSTGNRRTRTGTPSSSRIGARSSVSPAWLLVAFRPFAPRAIGNCGRSGGRRCDRLGSRITSPICGRAMTFLSVAPRRAEPGKAHSPM